MHVRFIQYVQFYNIIIIIPLILFIWEDMKIYNMYMHIFSEEFKMWVASDCTIIISCFLCISTTDLILIKVHLLLCPYKSCSLEQRSLTSVYSFMTRLWKFFLKRFRRISYQQLRPLEVVAFRSIKDSTLHYWLS